MDLRKGNQKAVDGHYSCLGGNAQALMPENGRNHISSDEMPTLAVLLHPSEELPDYLFPTAIRRALAGKA